MLQCDTNIYYRHDDCINIITRQLEERKHSNKHGQYNSNFMYAMLYIKTSLLFTTLYVSGILALGLLNIHFDIKTPSLRILIILISSLITATYFMKSEKRNISNKEAWILTFISLLSFAIAVTSLRYMANIPFMLSAFLNQLITAMAMLYITYGFIARNYLFKGLKFHDNDNNNKIKNS